MLKLNRLIKYYSMPSTRLGIALCTSILSPIVFANDGPQAPHNAEMEKTEPLSPSEEVVIESFDNIIQEMPKMALGARVGSVGWGLEYTTKISKPFYLRLVWQTLAPGDFDLETGDIELDPAASISNYNADGHFRSTGLITDWYPWDSSIRFSFGILRNSSEFFIDESTDTTEPLNRYQADYGKLAYFFGTGWAARQHLHQFSLTIDVGLLAQQPAKVRWLSDNQVRTDEQIQRIWSEKAAITKEMDDYKVLPFVMIGLNYQIY
ncbi:MAG TPA: hypothetical protein DHW71_12075 [Gammaproteobacteria bacterium]|nr:hypothetical protein [Gammaproteobacteria bacterium]